MIDVVQDALRQRIDALAVLAHHHAPGGAVEALYRKRRFQHMDALADIGRRYAKRLRGGGEARFARYLDKDAQVFIEQVILHKVCFIYSRIGRLYSAWSSVPWAIPIPTASI